MLYVEVRPALDGYTITLMTTSLEELYCTSADIVELDGALVGTDFEIIIAAAHAVVVREKSTEEYLSMRYLPERARLQGKPRVKVAQIWT